MSREECSPEIFTVPSAHGFAEPEGHDVDITRWHRMATYSAGSQRAAHSKKMTQQPGIPERSVGTPEAEDEGDQSLGRMRLGSRRGPIGAMTQGNE